MGMSLTEIQDRCAHGQQLLMEMQYIQAEKVLAAAETLAWEAGDYDAVSRLYMPLQETRRQIRQRCGEGIINLQILPDAHSRQPIDASEILKKYPHGQLLVAGYGTIEPALNIRKLQAEMELYVECFLAASYSIIGGHRAVVIVPHAGLKLPDPVEQNIDTLLHALPKNCIVFHENELPALVKKGTAETYSMVLSMWEKLHAPFYAAAQMQVDPVRKLQKYRDVIQVDYACELAHQNISILCQKLCRMGINL